MNISNTNKDDFFISLFYYLNKNFIRKMNQSSVIVHFPYKKAQAARQPSHSISLFSFTYKFSDI